MFLVLIFLIILEVIATHSNSGTCFYRTDTGTVLILFVFS